MGEVECLRLSTRGELWVTLGLVTVCGEELCLPGDKGGWGSGCCRFGDCVAGWLRLFRGEVGVGTGIDTVGEVAPNGEVGVGTGIDTVGEVTTNGEVGLRLDDGAGTGKAVERTLSIEVCRSVEGLNAVVVLVAGGSGEI